MTNKTLEQLLAEGTFKVHLIETESIYQNPDNPQTYTAHDMESLKRSLTDFPEMMLLRPVVVKSDKERMALGGNKRHQGCRELGWEKTPVIFADALTPEQLEEFIIKDNIGFGKWDNEKLKAQWDVLKLKDWGMDIKDLLKRDSIQGKQVISEEIDFSSNFIVLKFNKDIDWIQVQTLLGLETVYGTRRNGNPWSCGIGRVVDGVKAIEKIKAAHAEAGEFRVMDNSDAFHTFLEEKKVEFKAQGHATIIMTDAATFAALGYEFAHWSINKLKKK